MRITVETITDEQIRELRKEQLAAWYNWVHRPVFDNNRPPPFEPTDLDHSFVALREHVDGGRPGVFSGRNISRTEARARCAEILEARKEQKR